MAYKIKTEPATEPVTVAELKNHLRVTESDEDTIITSYGKVARRVIEKRLNRSLITTTWELYLDFFPANEIEINRYPVIAVSEIAYTDTDGSADTFASFQLDNIQTPARLYPTFDEDWPDTKDVINAVKITFTAGYGAAALVPEEFKGLIKLIVGHLYENRGDEGHKTLSKTVDMLIDLYYPYSV